MAEYDEPNKQPIENNEENIINHETALYETKSFIVIDIEDLNGDNYNSILDFVVDEPYNYINIEFRNGLTNDGLFPKFDFFPAEDQNPMHRNKNLFCSEKQFQLFSHS